MKYSVKIIINGELTYVEKLSAEDIQELLDKANELKEDE